MCATTRTLLQDASSAALTCCLLQLQSAHGCVERTKQRSVGVACKLDVPAHALVALLSGLVL